MIAELYWIHLPEHTDIFSQGYIGVTTLGTKERFLHHKRQSTKKSSKTVITSAIKKYGDDLVVDCLCIGEEPYIYDLENKLRPEKAIGWNLAVGGVKPFRPEKGTKPSQKTLDARKAMMTPEYREFLSKRNKDQGMGFQPGYVRDESSKERQRKTIAAKGPWNHVKASNNPAWALADQIRSLYDTGQPPAKIYTNFGLTWNNVKAILALFKTGWIPLEDDLWLKTFKEESFGT